MLLKREFLKEIFKNRRIKQQEPLFFLSKTTCITWDGILCLNRAFNNNVNDVSLQ